MKLWMPIFVIACAGWFWFIEGSWKGAIGGVVIATFVLLITKAMKGI